MRKYRGNADEALAQARATSDPGTRREWLEIAKQWQALADARIEDLNAGKAPSTKN